MTRLLLLLLLLLLPLEPGLGDPEAPGATLRSDDVYSRTDDSGHSFVIAPSVALATGAVVRVVKNVGQPSECASLCRHDDRCAWFEHCQEPVSGPRACRVHLTRLPGTFPPGYQAAPPQPPALPLPSMLPMEVSGGGSLRLCIPRLEAPLATGWLDSVWLNKPVPGGASAQAPSNLVPPAELIRAWGWGSGSHIVHGTMAASVCRAGT